MTYLSVDPAYLPDGDAACVLELLHVALSDERIQFLVGNEMRHRGEWLGPRVTGDPMRWLELKAAVLHRAAHRRFGTGIAGRWLPLWPETMVLPWCGVTVAVLGARIEMGEHIWLDVPQRQLFLGTLEAIEDRRVELAAMGAFKGSMAVFSTAHERAPLLAVPDFRTPRAWIRDHISILSTHASRPLPPGPLTGTGSDVESLVAIGSDPGASFVDAVTAALLVHLVVLTMPYLADDKPHRAGADGPGLDAQDLFGRLHPLAASATTVARPGGEGEAQWEGGFHRLPYRDEHLGRYYGHAAGGRIRQAVYMVGPGMPDADVSHRVPTLDADDDAEASGDGDLQAQLDAESPWRADPDRGIVLSDLHDTNHAGGYSSATASRLRLRVDEWDAVAQVRLPAWCTVSIGPAEIGSRSGIGRFTASPTLRRLISSWPHLGDKWHDRAFDGPRIAIDRYVAFRADRAAATVPDPRIYQSVTRAAPSVRAVCLVDASISTARQVSLSHNATARRGMTLLDVEEESVGCLAASMSESDHECDVYAYRSYGRHDVRLELVNVRPHSRGHASLQRIQPSGRSRLAAAMRGVGALMRRTDERVQVLLVVTDGLPFDHDYADHHPATEPLRYGLSDVAMALDELRHQHVAARLLVVGPEDGSVIDTFRGDARVAFVASPDDIGTRLAELYQSTGAEL
ncbi:MAG: hypothetical protein WEB67_11355 [Acidimicrobiia bacterium]